MRIFEAYRIPALALDRTGTATKGFRERLKSDGPAAFIVPIDPVQTYFPKIASSVTASGGVESDPLHVLSPELNGEVVDRVMPVLREGRLPTEGR